MRTLRSTPGGKRTVLNMMAHILGFKEQLPQQLDGEQIEYVLDALLQRALEPILRTTYFIEDVLAEMMHLVIDNRRRKVSAFDRNDELAAHIFSLIVTDDFETKARLLKKMQLERSILFHILQRFHGMTGDYIDSLPRVLRGKPTSIYLDALATNQSALRKFRFKKSRESFYYAVRESKSWMALAYRFRAMIVEKYVRFVYNVARRYVKATKLVINLNDLFKDLTLSTFKAIDKYRSEKGTLTMFLRWWLKDGATQSATSHEYGVSYHMPAARRRSMINKGKQIANFSHQIDEKTVDTIPSDLLEDEIVNTSEKNYLVRLAAHADKTRMGFLEMGLMYPLSQEEIAQLRATL